MQHEARTQTTTRFHCCCEVVKLVVRVLLGLRILPCKSVPIKSSPTISRQPRQHKNQRKATQPNPFTPEDTTKMILTSIELPLPIPYPNRVNSSAWVKSLKVEIPEPDQPHPSFFDDVYEESKDNGESSTLGNSASCHFEALRGDKTIEDQVSIGRRKRQTSTESAVQRPSRVESGAFLSREMSFPTVTGLERSSTVEFLQMCGWVPKNASAEVTTSKNIPVHANNQHKATPPRRVQMEEREKAEVNVDDNNLKEFDILSGRGGKSNHHTGNKRFRQIVAEMKSKYRTTSDKEDKTALSRAIVKYILENGGRFLKKEAGKHCWTVMTIAEARKKTSQALRETKELKWTAENP